MKPPDEANAERHIKRLLQEWTEEQASVERQTEETSGRGDARMWDFTVQLREETLVGEYKRSSDIATITRAIERLRKAQGNDGNVLFLVVPYMGEKGAGRCREEGISWIDLSGNAHLRTSLGDRHRGDRHSRG